MKVISNIVIDYSNETDVSNHLNYINDACKIGNIEILNKYRHIDSGQIFKFLGSFISKALSEENIPILDWILENNNVLDWVSYNNHGLQFIKNSFDYIFKHGEDNYSLSFQWIKKNESQLRSIGLLSYTVCKKTIFTEISVFDVPRDMILDTFQSCYADNISEKSPKKFINSTKNDIIQQIEPERLEYLHSMFSTERVKELLLELDIKEIMILTNKIEEENLKHIYSEYSEDQIHETYCNTNDDKVIIWAAKSNHLIIIRHLISIKQNYVSDQSVLDMAIGWTNFNHNKLMKILLELFEIKS